MNKIFDKALGAIDRPLKSGMGLKNYATFAIALIAGNMAGAAIADRVQEAQHGHESVIEKVAIRAGANVVALAMADGVAIGAGALLERRRREETASSQAPSGDITGE